MKWIEDIVKHLETLKIVCFYELKFLAVECLLLPLFLFYLLINGLRFL